MDQLNGKYVLVCDKCGYKAGKCEKNDQATFKERATLAVEEVEDEVCFSY